MPVMTRNSFEVDETINELAEKIAVGIENATVTPKSDGQCWSVGKMRLSVPGKFVVGEIILYHDPDKKIKVFKDPIYVQVVGIPKIIVDSNTDFEKLNEILLRSTITVGYRKYISKT